MEGQWFLRDTYLLDGRFEKFPDFRPKRARRLAVGCWVFVAIALIVGVVVDLVQLRPQPVETGKPDARTVLTTARICDV